MVLWIFLWLRCNILVVSLLISELNGIFDMCQKKKKGGYFYSDPLIVLECGKVRHLPEDLQSRRFQYANYFSQITPLLIPYNSYSFCIH